MTETTKLCKDCKHFRLPWLDRLLGGYIFGDCAKYFTDVPARTSPIDGERRPAFRHLHGVAFARFPHSVCGPDGNLWEPTNV